MSNPFKPRGGIIAMSAAPSLPSGEPVDFAAPVGRRVRLATCSCFALLGVVGVADVALVLWLHRMPRGVWAIGLAPLIIAVILIPVTMLAQIRAYRLTRDELVVARRNRENRFPFAGLRSVDVDREAMAWSMKVIGNDGLGAITGRFRNRRLGAYQALVTDRERAVVLRWPDRCIVISPDRPDEFATEVRRRAGLPH